MRESGFFVSAIVVFGVCGVVFAGPETMDFQSLEATGPGFVTHGQTYVEGSFRVKDVTFSGFGDLRSHRTGNLGYAGSTGLYNPFNNGTTELTKVGGGSFTLSSIDLAQLNAGTGGTSPVNFVGAFAAGGTIVLPTITIVRVATPAFVTYNFGAAWTGLSAAWTGLSKVTWVQRSGFHQFDNIVLDPENLIPLPGGAAMAMVGMGAVGVRRPRPISQRS